MHEFPEMCRKAEDENKSSKPASTKSEKGKMKMAAATLSLDVHPEFANQLTQ